MLQKEFFLHIENQYTNNLPFVAYSKPADSEIKALLQKNNNIFHTQNFVENGFVFAPFDDSNQTVFIPLDHSELLTCERENEHSNTFGKTNLEDVSGDKQAHIDLVQKGIASIEKESLQKVVLSRCESVSFQENQTISVFKKLLENYPDAFVYCWYHPKVGLWLGATPETLIDMSGNRFKTMALAGTQPYKDSMDVVWQKKEQEEQQMVTNFIENCLKSSANTLSVSEAKTVKAGTLLHLQSNISGILNTDLRTVLKKMHPTPAVCGLPVKRAKAFILTNEPYNREFYTGFLGELNFKETRSRNTNSRNVENNAYGSVKSVSRLFVNLRCMQIKNNRAFIYVGGGITKDSNPEKEWEETVSKAETMKCVLRS
ncbi:chorismate-binding protein [Psychroserpens mesophilus]|uniref:chorismate-binding protein n=1 Tax=Psychroserpens mesophilus TaxID=325473 RepID=UPI003D648888